MNAARAARIVVAVSALFAFTAFGQALQPSAPASNEIRGAIVAAQPKSALQNKVNANTASEIDAVGQVSPVPSVAMADLGMTNGSAPFTTDRISASAQAGKAGAADDSSEPSTWALLSACAVLIAAISTRRARSLHG
jgi:hypothetical protein